MFDVVASAKAIAKAKPCYVTQNTSPNAKKVKKVSKGSKKPSVEMLLEQKALKKFGKYIKIGGFHYETITQIDHLQELGLL